MALVRTSPGTSSSNTFRRYRYDVFLSFRGEETRKTFTDHLYTALNNAGFLTFRDDDELERGEDIKPGLQKAIQLSRTCIVVFSKDYASSRWCLDELVVILERKRTTSDHVVLPVFYDVDPSHVRKQTGSVGKAFARSQKNQSPEKVEGWRKALAEIADLAGMVLQNQADGYESKFIEKIVKVVGDKLSRTPLIVEPKLIGIESQVEDINLWLQDGSTDVGILVVFGMSGVGKTTIAKHVYNSNFRSFKGSSFIENISETADRPSGLVQIQKQLLSDILNGREVKIHGVSEGLRKIERAISSRRVLLVLDDVDHMDQLDAVLKMKDRFYPGSKILITTRRERLLKAHEVTKGTQTIQGLALDMRMHLPNRTINTNETVLETNAFERMRNLQLLHLSHVRLDGCYVNFPTTLRWLCWLEFPLDSIPVDLPLECLIVLEMQHSSLRQVWKGTKFLPSLKILDVSHSHALTEIVDFSLCPNLEELILVDCTSLIDVHESIGNLERLVYLNVKDCKNLRVLPKNMCFLKSLETLILSGCSNLDEFPVEMMKKMESLKVLEIDGIPISELWPERSSTILSSFPCSLVKLILSRCNLSEDAFPTDLSNLSSLRKLKLDENPICSLPGFIQGLRRLDKLSFCNCKKLESLVGLPRVHKKMDVSDCISLKKVTYQSFEGLQLEAVVGNNDNTVEWEYVFKLESIDRVDVEMIKLLGLCNLGSMPPITMNALPFSSYGSKVSPIQGLYECGIFSTCFVGNEVPGRFSYKSTKSSISFSVPLLPSSHTIRGLNIFATYANKENSNYNDDDDYKPPMIIKVSNKSKGLKWIYWPLFFGIPGDGEDMIWLSHWKMENETILQCGDQVVVSVVAGPHELFRIKVFGVELMQEHQSNMMISTQHNTKSDPNYPCVIGGDLSSWEHKPGLYFLCIAKEIVIDDDEHRWLNRLIMDNDEEATDKEEGQEDEPDYTIGRTRDANNNCGLRGWKVLLTAAGLFFSLALVVRSSISRKKKQQ